MSRASSLRRRGGQSPEHRADRLGRHLGGDSEDRFADRRAALLERLHEDERHELPEVPRGRHRAPPRRRAVGEAVGDLRHRDHAVGDLPAEEPLLERQPHVLVHALREGVERLEHIERRVSRIDLAETCTSTPEPGAAGSRRSPRSAWNGFVGVLRISTASPLPVGRSTQIVVVSRNATARP